MGITDVGKKIVSAITGRNQNVAPGVEFYGEHRKDSDADLSNYLAEIYEDTKKYVEPYFEEWRENRRAYMGWEYDHFGSDATLYSESGKKQIYNSNIVADKLDDLIAIQVGNNPSIFPMPEVSDTVNLATYITEDETPVRFVSKLWRACMKDLLERRHINHITVKLGLDARLCGFSPLKVIQKYDWETQQEDIWLQVVQPENFGVDPNATSLDDARYCYEDVYMSPFEAIQLYPKYREEIIGAIGKRKKWDRETGESRDTDTDRRKRQVCIVEWFLKDDSTMKVNKEAGVDEEGNPIIETVEERKYPRGRRVVWLPETKTVLEDKPNGYNGFPYSLFVTKPVSWTAIGRIEASALRALQYTDDYVIQQMIANLKVAGNITLIYDKNAGIDIEMWKDIVGQKIPVERMGSVELVKAIAIVQEAIMAHRELIEMSRSISGVTASSEGSSSGSLSSGVALSILQEGTNRKLRYVQNLYAEFLTRVGKQICDLMKDLYRAGRVIRVSDTDDIPMRLPVSLYEVTESVDVQVDADSQLPQDPVSRMQLGLSLMDKLAEDGLPLLDRQGALELIPLTQAKETAERIEKKKAQGLTVPQGQGQGRGVPAGMMNPMPQGGGM